MKRLLCLLAVTALLTGCGIDESTVSKASAPESESSETTEAPTEEETEAPTEEVTDPPTEAPAQETEPETQEPTDQPEEQVSEGVEIDFLESYKSAVLKACEPFEEQGYGSVSFTLYDVYGDGTPELIMKTGTCEADFRIGVYTLNESGETVQIGEDLGGSHTSFGLNDETGRFSLIYGHMGSGGAVQIEYQQGQFVNAGEEAEVEFSDSDDFFAQIKEKGYRYMDFSEIWISNPDVRTWIYRMDENGSYSDDLFEEYDGKDLRFFDQWLESQKQ